MNSSETPGSTSIFRPIHMSMRCWINALKPQMFISWSSKFSLGPFWVGLCCWHRVIQTSQQAFCWIRSWKRLGLRESGADFVLHDTGRQGGRDDPSYLEHAVRWGHHQSGGTSPFGCGQIGGSLGQSRIGSVLNCAGHPIRLNNGESLSEAFHDASVRAKGYPTLYGIDAIHGATYTAGCGLGPQQLALVATWDAALVRVMAEGTAKEIGACGLPWNFAPVLDVGHDPRWPRFWETLVKIPSWLATWEWPCCEVSRWRFESGCHPQTLPGVQHAVERKRPNARLHSRASLA